ncbi:MAG: CpXC domain-containing protein [Candidatus Heimdallarchaeaceae archaeon]
MNLKELTCSNCGTIIRKKVMDAINVTDNPKSIKDIIEGKINYSICPNCKSKIKHKSHVLVTYLNPPRWVWLVDKKYQQPSYENEFFKTVIPSRYSNIIEQEMVFVEFGEPCYSLRYVLEKKQPQAAEEWLELGKIYTGKKAVSCYQQALKLNKNIIEAKKLLNEELDKLKTYS